MPKPQDQQDSDTSGEARKLTKAQWRALRKISRRDWPAGEPRLDWLNRATASVLLRLGMITEREGTAGSPFSWSAPIVDLTEAGRAALQAEAR